MSLVACELVSFGVYRWMTHQWFSHAAMRARRDEILRARAVTPGGERQAHPDWMKLDVIHPYLGFVQDPVRGARLDADVNAFGYPGPTPLQERRPGTKIVGVFGGSVAMNEISFKDGREQLFAELARSGPWQGQQIRPIIVALGGYKQPQMLIALAYLLSLGAQFDAVIELDGFNDIALPTAENVPAHIFPFYPRRWNLVASYVDDLPRLTAIGRIASLRDDERALAARWDRSWLRFSVTANVIYWLRARSLEAAAATREAELLASADDQRYVYHGPPRPYANDRAMYEDVARVWKESSLQMARLAAANGIEYFHFLQPNQYDLGSKTLTAWEREHAYDAQSPYRWVVERGYDDLRRAGAELARAGVRFHDLTRLFVGNGDSVYYDTCCHLNETGRRLLGLEMGRLIRQDLEASPQRAAGR